MASDVVALFARVRELRLIRLTNDLWTASDYWQEYLRVFCALTQSSLPRVFRFDDGQWYVREGINFIQEQPLSDAEERPHLEKACRQSFALAELVTGVSSRRAYVSLAPLEHVVLCVELSPEAQQRLSEVMVRAQLIGDVPSHWLQEGQEADQLSLATIQKDPDWLRLLAHIHAGKNFRVAATSWVNGLVNKFHQVELAAVGWRRGDYLRLEVVSHFEKFQHKTELIKSLEVAMEEASDQGISILYGDGRTQPFAVRAHQQLQRVLGSREILTVPVVDNESQDEVVVVLVSFDQPLLTQLEPIVRYIALTVLPQLRRLHQKRRGVVGRMAAALAQLFKFLLGQQHWISKAVGILVVVLVLALVLVKLPHRVEGEGRLLARTSQVVTAPYDGFLDKILVDSGDFVKKGDVIVTLDTQDLLLQLSEVDAELLRFQAERDAARARRELVEVNINEAKIGQTQARRERLIAYLSQSQLKAPFDGVVVEGDRTELLSSPVELGDKLFRIAALDSLFVRATILEHDVVFLDNKMSGEFAFVSLPHLTHPVTLDLIFPEASFAEQRGNGFDLDLRFQEGAQPWWRPGMSGVVKLDAGDKAAWWIFSHRIIDRLRLFFWW